MWDRAQVEQGCIVGAGFGPDPADLEMDTRARQPHREKSRAEHSLTRGKPSLPGT